MAGVDAVSRRVAGTFQGAIEDTTPAGGGGASSAPIYLAVGGALAAGALLLLYLIAKAVWAVLPYLAAAFFVVVVPLAGYALWSIRTPRPHHTAAQRRSERVLRPGEVVQGPVYRLPAGHDPLRDPQPAYREELR